MKVLHILNELNPSGAEVMLKIASCLWQKKGINGHILATGNHVGIYSTELEKAGFIIHHIPLYPKIKFIIVLVRLIKKYQFEIIHIHSEGASLYSVIASKISKRKVIIRTVHHIWPCQRILPFIKRYIFRFITNKIFKITSVSNSISGRKNEKTLYHIENLLIPNWYDNHIYSPIGLEEKKSLRESQKISEDTVVLISIGKNWPYKNFDLVIKAIANLPDDLKILYFQIGPDFQGNNLENLTNSLQITRKVKIMGKVKDPLAYLQLSDAFIMPSSNEGFGNAVLEAMGCGIPCILSDVPALCDFNEYFDNIYWIKPDFKDIVKAILFFSTMNFYERFNYARFNAEKVKKLFGIENGTQKYYELYMQLLRSQGSFV